MNEGRGLRIVYMGTPDFAVASLQHLVENDYNIVAVITAPDKPAGRGQQVQKSAVKQYAQKAGLKILQPVKLKDPEFVREFKELDADLGIVIAFRMLPEIIWSMPRLGTFNLHASLLPQYRGAAPINWAIINGEDTTGVTTFFINNEIDKGNIIMQQGITIEPDDTAGTLHDKLMELGATVVQKTIDIIADDSYNPVPQKFIHTDHLLKDAPKIFKETCRIDWNKYCSEINNFVRGLSPHPAAWCELKNSKGEVFSIKVFSVTTDSTKKPSEDIGSILSDGKDYLKAVCRDGYVFIEELQAAGKKRMPVEEFLRGFKL